MAYISSETLLRAFRVLSDVHPGGSTTFASQLRYTLAVDFYKKKFGSPCDIKENTARTEFVKGVGGVVQLNEDSSLYTVDFAKQLRKSSDYKTSSNLFTQSVGLRSLESPEKIFTYPQSGSEPLLKIQNQVFDVDGDTYQNIPHLLNNNPKVFIALILWVLRFTEFSSTDDVKDALINKWNMLVTDEMSQAIPVTDEGIADFSDITFSEYKSKISEEDIRALFNPTVYLNKNKSLQLIWFGAPGTGKSFTINSDSDVTENNTLRTTFHPDSDYSTFVGCYKPTKKPSGNRTSIDANDLVEKASAISGVANQVQFLCDNAESIIIAANELGVSPNKLVWEKFRWHNETYFVSILNFILDERKKNAVDEITYDFCPQAFTNAYVRAWQNPDTPFFLIIEEINRGNCAQIFGDIFQLLDRDENGLSRYKITPDNDLRQYLGKVFAEADITDASIKSGETMQLPPNLHIWATMNTSDQSLFPIDSAFKRRWDWKYIPIDCTDRGHYITCNGKRYSWAKFLERVNEDIEGVTQSEDKKLGYWFTGNSATQLEITADKFVSKVVFYLWNDIFKDFGHNGKTIFKDDFSKFHKFFDYNGSVKEDILEKFLTSLDLKSLYDINETGTTDSEDSTE